MSVQRFRMKVRKKTHEILALKQYKTELKIDYDVKCRIKIVTFNKSYLFNFKIRHILVGDQLLNTLCIQNEYGHNDH